MPGPAPTSAIVPQDPVSDCEEALAAHWSQLGRLPGGTLHEDDGLVWFETPVRHLPYNGVPRTRLTADRADAVIDRVVGHMRARGADLWWAVPPSATPDDLAERLARAGLRRVETMHFMALDLAGWDPPPPSDVALVAADDPARIETYCELTYAYWEIPPEERDAVAVLQRAIGPSRLPGQRYLAELDGRTVGKAYLSFPGPPGVASLYGMSVLPEARGRGVAAAVTSALMSEASRRGCHRAVLHATDMAVGVYRRIGFEHLTCADVYATAEIWTEHRR